jgi:hypothetical protein
MNAEESAKNYFLHGKGAGKKITKKKIENLIKRYLRLK